MAEIIKELEPQVRGQKVCVAKVHDKFYFVSSVPTAPDHGGPETLAFACDENGEVEHWADLAGGRGMSREQTISQLEEGGEAPYAFSDTANPMDVMRVCLDGPGPGYYVDDGDVQA